MAVRLTAGLTAQWFTPESQAGEIAPARFFIRPLSTFERLDLFGMVNEKLNGQASDLVLRATLKNWENVVDAEGVPIAFELDKIELLPVGTILELASELSRRAALGETEIKN